MTLEGDLEPLSCEFGYHPRFEQIYISWLILIDGTDFSIISIDSVL